MATGFAGGLTVGGLGHTSLFDASLFGAGIDDATVTPSTVATAWDSADLARRFKQRLGRGNGGVMKSDELWTNDRIYECLADAQEQVYSDLSPIVPLAFISAPVLLTSSDGGVTYDFPQFPFGHVEVFAQERGARQLFASTYSNPSGDFLFEASRLRSPGNHPRTYASGPWARFSGFPERLTASVSPSLQPAQARELILYRALVIACETSGGQLDPDPFQKAYAEARMRWITLWKTQDSTAGRAGGLTRIPWWLTLSQFN